MIKQYAKAWTSGLGAAALTYISTWSDDPRVLGLVALLTAVAVALVPNQG